MRKIYVLPEFIDFLMQENDRICNFVVRLSKINEFLFRQKRKWNVKFILDFSRIEEFTELELYDARVFASLWLDSNSFFDKPRLNSDYSDYLFYVITPFTGLSHTETCDHIHIELGMLLGGADVINARPYDYSILRIHRFKQNIQPSVVTHKYLALDYLEIDLFLDNYVSSIISENDKFLEFRNAYIYFYQLFNWENWLPSNNPAPAHSVLLMLRDFYKRSNDDFDHLSWGYIMAVLNGGIYNKQLTLLNSKKRTVNDVFQLGINKGNATMFYSIDTENGNLEIYDYRGVHINKVYGLVSGLQIQNRSYFIDVCKDKWL